MDLVLIGHSLGGLVSTYIAEHLTSKLVCRPTEHADRSLGSVHVRVRGVVAISAPIGGSVLLAWLRDTLPRSLFPVPVLGINPFRGIGRDFCPDARTILRLRAKVAASEDRLREQRDAVPTASPLSRDEDACRLFISGACDPLVLPPSALAHPEINTTNTAGYSRVLVPHCGHYSIKISTVTWTAILKFVEQTVPHLNATES